MRNYAEATIKSYKATFRLFLKDTKISEITEISKELLEQWFFDSRVRRNWSTVSFWTHHKHLNAFLKWMHKQEYIPQNYLDDVEKPRLEKKLPKTLSKDQAKIILDASFNYPYFYRFARYRNRAIVGIMLLAGLRRKEVINLKYGDVSIETRTIFIQQGKGNKDRMIPMNHQLCNILEEYIYQRRKFKKKTLNMFCSIQRDEPIKESAISNLMFKLRKVTRIKFSAHTLRHAFARLMLEGGCDIYTLSKIMGHSKITTTTIYLACSSKQMSKSIEMHSLNSDISRDNFSF